MREYELIIDEALRKGLTPFDINPFNMQLLNECLGFRIGKAGLELYEAKENPLPGTVDMYYSWPFPQFIVGELYNILVIRDTINEEDVVYSVSNDHATVNLIFNIDELTFGQGGLMELADFGEYAFMTNGVVMLYWNPATASWVTTTAIATIPMMTTICNFKGQCFGGGVLSAWHDCDETFYCWSKIGEIDFTPEADNTAGYRRDPYGGRVLAVRRLENKIIGWSTEGVTLITPVDDPAVTFGFTELDDVGLLNKGAMAGDYLRRLYVGEDYILRMVTREGITELGYKQYMEQLKGEDVIITYDKANKDFYIGNSTKTYLLSPNGLSEVPQHPSAVWRKSGTTYMLPDAEDDYLALIVTEAFDFGYKGLKTIFTVETDLLVVDDPEVALDYYNSILTFGTTGYKPINNDGICSIIASGNAFRIRLRFNPIYDNTRIGYIRTRYKMTDLKGIRGVHAPPPRGQ